MLGWYRITKKKKILLTLTLIIVFSSFSLASPTLHFTAGAGIYTAMYLTERANIYQFQNKLMLVLLAGISKEIHDYFYPKHTASIKDIGVTFAGGLLAHSILKW